jgi:hypothetical protein
MSSESPAYGVRAGSSAFHSVSRQRSSQPGWNPGTIGTLAIAAIATGLPVVLHLAAPWLAIGICLAIGVLIANFAVSAAIVTLIFSYLFQNLLVAVVSPAIDNMNQFNEIRAYNFILTGAIWLSLAGAYWTTRDCFDQRFRAVIDLTTVALLLIGAYTAIGYLSNPAGALVYMRNIAAPFFLFQIFAIVAYQNRLSISAASLVMASAALLYGYFEVFAHETLLSLVNGDTYLEWRTRQDHDAGIWLKELQQSGRVIRGHLDTMVVDFLNTPLLGNLGLRFYRILGPNFHFISFAYALAFFVVLLAAGGRPAYAVFALPLLLLVGSKGALILAGFVLFVVFVLQYCSNRVAILAFLTLLGAYAVFGIAAGMLFQDYHVLGFVGGLNGFLTQPLGRGIGVGGNLSLDMTTIDWSRSQQLGQTDIAVESAIGVLLYQMGVFGIAILGLLPWLALKLWKLYSQRGDRLFAVGACALLTILVNGIFQEEALFSPLALGMILGFAGFLLGRAYRPAAAATRR